MTDDQTRHLLMMLTVMKSAYAALAGRLSRQGLVDLDGLSSDLKMLAEVQDDPVWRAEHVDLAGLLHSYENLPSNSRQ